MAIYNQGFDISLKCGSDYVKTTTMQYRVVGIPNTSTANYAFNCYAPNAGAAVNNTLTARCALGIIQDLPSANSTEVNVRLMGISKAVCAYTVKAGDFLYTDIQASTTFGKVYPAMPSTTNPCSAGMSASTVVLGRALEDGTSNAVISIILYPHICVNE